MPLLSRFARYFEVVAREGSLRRASERLHLSASAIDRQILAAEEILGQPLFERLPQGLRLTAAGGMLLDLVRRAQDDLDRLHADLDDLRGLRRGRVSLALVESASFSFLPAVLAGFRADYPNIGFDLCVTGSEAAVAAVLAGEVDLGLAINPRERPGLEVRRSAAFPLGVAVPPGHPLAAIRPQLADCVRFPLVMPDGSLALRAVIDRALARLPASIEPVASCNSIALMKMLVETGAGIGLMNEINVAAEAAAGRLVWRSLAEGALYPSVLSLCLCRGRDLSLAARAAVRAFAAALDALAMPAAAQPALPAD